LDALPVIASAHGRNEAAFILEAAHLVLIATPIIAGGGVLEMPND